MHYDNPAYVEAFIKIAKIFIARLGFFPNEAEIEYEINLVIERLGLEKLEKNIGGKFNNDAYITMLRIGSKTRLSRKERIPVAGMLNKAMEHAYYEAIWLPKNEGAAA